MSGGGRGGGTTRTRRRGEIGGGSGAKSSLERRRHVREGGSDTGVGGQGRVVRRGKKRIGSSPTTMPASFFTTSPPAIFSDLHFAFSF
jgi:hypothetical protein